LLRIPRGVIAERMAFVNGGSRTPGALLVAYEDDTWMLAVFRPVGDGDPPTTFDEMVAVVEQMLPASIIDGLRGATPAGEVSIARSTAAVWRRYDRTAELPEGLVVLGDALCHLNPMYGQGMSMAALQAVALRDCLEVGFADLPRRFYLAAAEQILPVWTLNRANDRVPSRTAKRRLRNQMQQAALRAATTDIAVAERVLRVRGLIDPPARLQDPSLWLRIMLVNLRYVVPRKLPIQKAFQRGVARRFPRWLAAR
jgi:2-polyprenyl-6-methoxyphenol hydroxylase-like FAD-dependent oxidoreductase